LWFPPSGHASTPKFSWNFRHFEAIFIYYGNILIIPIIKGLIRQFPATILLEFIFNNNVLYEDLNNRSLLGSMIP